MAHRRVGTQGLVEPIESTVRSCEDSFLGR